MCGRSRNHQTWRLFPADSARNVRALRHHQEKSLTRTALSSSPLDFRAGVCLKART